MTTKVKMTDNLKLHLKLEIKLKQSGSSPLSGRPLPLLVAGAAVAVGGWWRIVRLVGQGGDDDEALEGPNGLVLLPLQLGQPSRLHHVLLGLTFRVLDS